MTTTPTLVLDPGHGSDREVGGSSPNNTSGGGVLEKDVTLDMARRVRQRLAGRANVLLTRDSDTNLSLAQRAGFARAVGADLFLSLHCNGHVDPSHDSIEVYVNRDGTESDRAFAADLEAALASAIGAPESDVIQADLGVINRDRHTPGTIVALVEMFDLTNPARAQAATDVRVPRHGGDCARPDARCTPPGSDHPFRTGVARSRTLTENAERRANCRLAGDAAYRTTTSSSSSPSSRAHRCSNWVCPAHVPWRTARCRSSSRLRICLSGGRTS